MLTERFVTWSNTFKQDKLSICVLYHRRLFVLVFLYHVHTMFIVSGPQPGTMLTNMLWPGLWKMTMLRICAPLSSVR